MAPIEKLGSPLENNSASLRINWTHSRSLPVGFLLLRYSVLLLLSPYLCFISLLYLDLYVLGDDALIS